MLAIVPFIGMGCKHLNPFSQYFEIEEPGEIIPTKTIQPEQETESENEEKDIEEESEEVIDQKSYSGYSGAYFDIEYPSNFRVDERVLEGSFEDEYAEVAFLSPNENVEFYVFSPLWGGYSAYETILDSEEIVAEQVTSTGGEFNKKTVEWITVEAKDGSYARSMRIITMENETVRYLFGIKYSSQEALEQYREEYNHFTESLKQYADA